MSEQSMIPRLLRTLYDDALDLVRDARDMMAAAPLVGAEGSAMAYANIAAMPLVTEMMQMVGELAELREAIGRGGAARPDAARTDGAGSAILLQDCLPAYLKPLAARFAQIERRYAQLRLAFADGPPTVQSAVVHACERLVPQLTSGPRGNEIQG